MSTSDELDRAVAIVGVGGVFPGARTASAFWTNVLTQTDCIRDIPRERFDADVFFDPDPLAEDTSYCRVGGVVDDIPVDPRELRMPPLEAASVDRLQLLAFAAARDALSDAGYDKRPFDRSRTAVILGYASGRTEVETENNWRVQHSLVASVARRRLRALRLAENEIERALEELRERLMTPLRPITAHTLVGLLPNVAAGRVASALDLHGPNYMVDSACASSLAALDQVVEGLVRGDFDVALTGGCHALLDPTILVGFSKFHGLSRTRSRPFDAAADGFVVGEGAGVFVAKRLADAIRDGDRICAVVRGVGSSSDGRGKSMAAPDPRAQALALRRALAAAGYGADTVQFVETHGAGTPVGDRAEIEGLVEAFGESLRPGQRIFLGATKSHVGHLMGAAGAAGLVATVLGLHNEVLPPVFGFEHPHPGIPWAELPFDVVTEPTLWPPNVDGLPRRAGVSSLGFGGTNFHAAIEAFDPAFHGRGAPRRRSRPETREPIAIVGIASVLPDAPTVDDFWANVVALRYSIAPLPDARFEGDRALFVDPKRETPDTTYTDIGSTVERVELDPEVFRLAPSTVEQLDHEQRAFLTCAARALADAGYTPEKYDRSRIAIVGGDSIGCRQAVWDGALRLNALRAAHALSRSSVLEDAGIPRDRRTAVGAEVRAELVAGRPPATEDTVLGQTFQIALARLTKAFDWTGPQVVVDAACASGLGALSVAVGGLRAGRWDFAVVGNSSGGVLPSSLVTFARTTALSSTGSRPFSSSADGLVLGEGTVVFVLKRLRDAIRDGDRVYAVVRGIGASSDGRGRSLMAPNPDGQALALTRAWEDARLDPATVQLVECHATATPVGDDVEIESMRRVFGGANGRVVGIGSVKSQIGHLAGGAAGPALLKATLGLYHRTLPPTVAHDPPSEALTKESTRFRLVTEAEPWPENSGGEPRRAGVNSFGFGGTNFHAVLEEYEPAYHRRLLEGGAAAQPAALPRDAVAFLFPGQGAWYADMLRDLYAEHAVVRATFAEANETLLTLVGESVEEILFTSERRTAHDVEARLLDGELAQPALVAASTALDRLLRYLGVAPHVVAGHSLGEYSALVAAGVLGLGDALRAAHARARALRRIGERGDAGCMAAVLAGEADVRRVLADVPGYVGVANLNSPSQTVISGETEAVQEALRRFGESGIDSRLLPIAAAYHSELAHAAQPALAEALHELAVGAPGLPVVSTVTGEFVEDAVRHVKTMLVEQLGAPVDFVAVVRRLYAAGARTFVEVGPKRVLTPFVDAILAGEPHAAVAANHATVPDRDQLARALDVLRGRSEPEPQREDIVAPALEALSTSGLPLEDGRLPPGIAAGAAVIYADTAGRAGRAEMRRASARLRDEYLKRLEAAVSEDERLGADRWFADEQSALAREPRPPARTEDADRRAAPQIAEAIGARGAAVDLIADAPGDLARAVARSLVDGGTELAIVVECAGDDGREFSCSVVGSLPSPIAPPAVPETPATTEAEGPGAPPPGAATASPEPTGGVAEVVLALVAEATGYERELLELDLDLEADLGIDTIKQAQIMGAIAERFGFALDPGELRLRDFPTLRRVIEFVEAQAAPLVEQTPAAAPEPAGGAAETAPISRLVVSSRPVPLSDERPNLTVGPGWTVLVVGGDEAAAACVARAVEERGAGVAIVPLDGTDAADLGAERELVEARARCGPFDGIVYLHEGSDVGVPARRLFHVVAALAGDLRAASQQGRGFLAAAGPHSPDGAAVAGLLKSAAKELPALVVKAIEFRGDTPAADAVAETFLAEVERGGGRVEVTWVGGDRLVPKAVAQPLEPSPEPVVRLSSSVLLLVGGGRGITAEIAARLAHSFHPTLVIWGTSVLDDETRRAADLDEEGLDRLRQEYLARARRMQPDAPPRVLDEDFQRVARSVETHRTLRRLEERGATVQYETVDVRDGDAVADAMQSLLARHGRLDGVVFGAGTIEDKLLEDKHPASFDRVFDVKVRGFPNVVRALNGTQPQFVVALSSIAGLFGNRGQGDYAAANSFVDRMMTSEAERRPGRWVSIAWGPWDRVGLVARSGLAGAVADSGVALIEPDDGAHAFEAEILNGHDPMVVIAGGVEVLDRDGIVVNGADVFDEIAPDGPGGLVATRTFDLERDRWLSDHVIGGGVILPGVVGIELLVQAAAALRPGRRFSALEDLRIHRAVKLLRNQPATVRVRARVDDATDRVRVTLESTFVGANGITKEQVHYDAVVEMANRFPPTPRRSAASPESETIVARTEIYAPAGPLPHGPTFQVLDRVALDGVVAVGAVANARAIEIGGASRTMPLEREAALQTAGLHAIVQHGILALPVACRRIDHFADAPPGVALRTEARLRAVHEDGVEYDIDLVGDDGTVYDRMTGYRAARVTAAA